jgi:lysophospholipase L1-like esterase
MNNRLDSLKKNIRCVLRKTGRTFLLAGAFSFITAEAQIPTDNYFVYNRNSGLNLAPSGGGTGNGTVVVQWGFASSTSTAQQWTMTSLGSGQYSMKSVPSGRAVSIPNAQTGNGVGCQIWDYTGVNQQRVTLQSRGSGFYSLLFVHSGKAMTVYAASTSAGANVIQYDNNGGWNAQWRLHPASRRCVPRAGSTWMAKYLSNQNATKSTHYNLIFDGDSITDFWRSTGSNVWNANWAPKGAYDYGISGDRTEHLWWRLLQGQADFTNPKLVVLLIGTNNLSSDDTATIASKITTLVNDYLTHCPNAHILLLGILPRGQAAGTALRNKIIDINNRISSLNGSGGGRVIYRDIGSKLLQSDGTISTAVMYDYLHPTAAGYQIIADNIRSVVNTYVP